MAVHGGDKAVQNIFDFEVTQPSPEVSVGRALRDGVSLARWAGLLRQPLVVLALVLADTLLALLVWVVVSMLQNAWGYGLSETATATVAYNIAVWVALRGLLGLYPGYGLAPTEELRRQTNAVLATLAITAVFAFAFHIGDVLWCLLLSLGFSGLAVAAPLVRYFVKRAMNGIGLWGKPVVVLSFGEAGGNLVRLLKKEWTLGLKPTAIFDSRVAPVGGRVEGVPYGGSVAEAMGLDWKGEAETAIFAMPNIRRENLVKFVERARVSFRHVVIIPNLGGITNSAVVARDFAGTFGVEVGHNLLDPWTQRTKRVLDLGVTLVGGILVLPVILVLYLLVCLESGGPAFYRAERMGRDNKPFACVKFRTMVPDAEVMLQRLLAEDEGLREEYAKYHKLRDDPRVTRVGRFLRKTSLDELPQLWNVLKGEMSLVGPRPYLPRESGEIGATQGDILRVYPGITGPWQVGGRSQTSFGDRVRMDSYYVHNWSIWLDILLLARTVRCVLLDRGAY